MEYKALWEPIAIGIDETLAIQLGSLNLWIHRGDGEWHIASEHQTEDLQRLSVVRCREMSDLDWTRWIINEEIDHVHLSPCMPDRPVIVRPEMPVSLPPKQSVQFYVGVPSSVTIALGSRFRNITRVPTIILSNSWFGPSTEGELCYAMRTTAKLRQADLQPHPHRIVVPFEIRNRSEEMLDFARICMHTKHLRIYEGNGRMWTNQCRATYRGEDKWSRVVYARGVPPFDGEARLIGKALEPEDRGAILRTFDNWKNMADF